VLDHLFLDRALEGEVELLQRLARGEPRGLDAVSPPCASREDCSVESSAWAKRS
jgi:hypothetical protein